MTGVRLGGIDPSILRELSGVYKPFVKAFKELISNAFDADADHVHVTIADDFSSVTIFDDGEGMTPFEFRNDFTRIGGGSRRWLGEKTQKGRLRIGSKGIGFLALARYCNRLEVESAGSRTFQYAFDIEETPVTIKLDDLIGFTIPEELIARRMQYQITQFQGRIGELTLGTHFKINTVERVFNQNNVRGLSRDARQIEEFERLLEGRRQEVFGRPVWRFLWEAASIAD